MPGVNVDAYVADSSRELFATEVQYEMCVPNKEGAFGADCCFQGLECAIKSGIPHHRK